MHKMLAGDLTQVSTVQTWECDSNAHLNVQFFHQRFREAGCFYRQKNHLGGVPMAHAHTRFYRELHADDVGQVVTLPVRDANGALFLMHRLTVDGTTAACITLDRLEDPAVGLQALPLADFTQAGPRGLTAGPPESARDLAARVDAGIAQVSCITQALPGDMDHTGAWRAERVISSFSNGGQSAWVLVGATTDWLRDNNLGRVVLEMKYDCSTMPEPGTILRQTSFPLALEGKTYRFCHQIEDALTGQVYAVGEMLAVLMDFGTRKVAPIPSDLALPAGP